MTAGLFTAPAPDLADRIDLKALTGRPPGDEHAARSLTLARGETRVVHRVRS